MSKVLPTKKNILATLTYYDVLEYPLTAFEVRKFLMNYHNQGEVMKVTLKDVYQKLQELKSEGKIELQNGFWFLTGRESLVAIRIAKEKISIQKLKKMRSLVALLKHLPFIRMIAATGSLSYRHGSKGSDWDMLVVLEEKALFTGRLVLTAFLQILGKRRHGKKIANRACLNYFTGSESLTVRLTDWYAAHEYQIMVPLFQTLKSDAFYRANGWLLGMRSHVHLPVAEHRLTVKDTITATRFRKVLEKMVFSGALEKLLREWQMKKIAQNPVTQKKGACIIADEHSLVFFPSPRGPKVFEKFQSKLTF